MQEHVNTTPTVVIETHPAKEYRSYHTNFLLSRKSITDFSFPITSGSYGYDMIGDAGQELLADLTEIGLWTNLYVRPYSITIGKTRSATWSQIEPLILDALKHCLPEENQKQLQCGYASGVTPEDQTTLNLASQLFKV